MSVLYLILSLPFLATPACRNGNQKPKFNYFVFGSTDDQTMTEVDGIDEEHRVKLANEGFEKVNSFLPSYFPAGLIKNITFLWHTFFSPPGHNQSPTV